MNAFWTEMNRELESVSQPLKNFAHCPEDMMPAAFRAYEEWCRPEIDQACLQWIRFGTWPELTPEQMWWVCLRFLGAEMMVTPLQLATWTVHPTRYEALRWLLLEVWPLRIDVLAAEVLIPLDEHAEEKPQQPPHWMK